MEESTITILEIMFRSGRTLLTKITNTELEWLFDKMFGRTEGSFQNFSDVIVNVNDIEYVRFHDEEEVQE